MIINHKAAKTEKKRLETLYNIISLVIALVLGVSAALLSYSRFLYEADEMFTNFVYLYTPFEKADSRITIISIDDDTISEYGEYHDWSRQVLADAVNALNENNASIIGLDVDLSGVKDTEGDEALVEACKNAGNVVAIATADYDSADKNSDSSQNNDLILSKPADSSIDWSDHKTMSISFPYHELEDVVTTGISNALQQSPDGIIRTAALSISYNDNDISSFASTIYMKYQDSLGQDYNMPNLSDDELFGFNRINNAQSYQIISLSDLLAGNADSSLIDGHITIIGALQIPDESMYYYQYLKSDYAQQEVLTETSIIQTLLNDKSVTDVPRLAMALLAGFITALFSVILRKKKKLWHIILQFLCIAVGIFIAMNINHMGLRVLLLVPMIFCILAIIINLFFNLIYANFEKRRMELTLKMYVDSQVVDQISDFTPMELSSVSARRNIAVLFVDIRGFTSMSESLEPEQVVSILNEYFSVVYSSIIAWNGTLDKFIGDAAMAIFNAPNDVDDYVFNAVCAADDIQKNFEPLREKFMSEYGKEVHLGIGINSGTAIVGNIGCMGRFDYTAIGDTVNTASRLESKALPGQILISETVYAEVESRVSVDRVGALSLKGKAQTVETYQIITIDKPKAPNKLLRKGFLREQTLLYTKTK
ncbi:MAG: adenylate/guanylate cyclase domain-containing protein [Lachnobacterium sp.]|nr:adenylate/guanylate cyclase domain-containing protein [Lachnobacterium sp.]